MSSEDAKDAAESEETLEAKSAKVQTSWAAKAIERCLRPGCGRRVFQRGLCGLDHKVAKSLIDKHGLSWEQLVSLGKAKPMKKLPDYMTVTVDHSPAGNDVVFFDGWGTIYSADGSHSTDTSNPTKVGRRSSKSWRSYPSWPASLAELRDRLFAELDSWHDDPLGRKLLAGCS